MDPALLRPGRLDRKIEFGLPDLEVLYNVKIEIIKGRAATFKIHTKSMSIEKNIRYDLLARLCPNSTGIRLKNEIK